MEKGEKSDEEIQTWGIATLTNISTSPFRNFFFPNFDTDIKKFKNAKVRREKLLVKFFEDDKLDENLLEKQLYDPSVLTSQNFIYYNFNQKNKYMADVLRYGGKIEEGLRIDLLMSKIFGGSFPRYSNPQIYGHN